MAIITALVSVEELNSVEDATLRSQGMMQPSFV